jgi:hypothetical protein
MARPLVDVIVELNIEYVPIPKAEVTAWRAGFSLLLQLLRTERKMYKTEVSHANKACAWVLGRGTVHRIRLADWSSHYAWSTHS